MNARQTKKNLKNQIHRLKSDNDLMHEIIADSPRMQELYDRFNKPVNVHYTTMEFQEFKAKRKIPFYMVDVDGYVEYTKQVVAKDLFEDIKDNISYEIDSEYGIQTITASIFVGRK